MDAKANEHKTRYLRFKADESAQAITGPYRQTHPEDNNERQPIHEHVSVALAPEQRKKVPARQAASHTAIQEGPPDQWLPINPLRHSTPKEHSA